MPRRSASSSPDLEAQEQEQQRRREKRRATTPTTPKKEDIKKEKKDKPEQRPSRTSNYQNHRHEPSPTPHTPPPQQQQAPPQQQQQQQQQVQRRRKRSRKQVQQIQCYLGCGVIFFLLGILIGGLGALALALCVFANNTITINTNTTNVAGSVPPTTSTLTGVLTCFGGASAAVSTTASAFTSNEITNMSTTPTQIFNLNQWQLGLLGLGFAIAGFLCLIIEAYFNRAAYKKSNASIDSIDHDTSTETYNRNNNNMVDDDTDSMPSGVRDSCPIPCLACVRRGARCYRFSKMILSRFLWYLLAFNIAWFLFTVMLYLLFQTTTTISLNNVSTLLTDTTVVYTLGTIPGGCTAPAILSVNEVQNIPALNGNLYFTADYSIVPPIWALAIICAVCILIVLLVKCVPASCYRKCCCCCCRRSKPREEDTSTNNKDKKLKRK